MRNRFCLALAAVFPVAALALTTQRAPEYFAQYDLNHDGKIDRAEWVGRGNFELLDANRDEGLDLSEFSGLYESGMVPAPTNPILPVANPPIDASIGSFEIAAGALSTENKCAFSRGRNCADNYELSIQSGLFETGLSPAFPAGARCQGVDETFAMSYTFKRGREASHGGIDIPADFDTPILAVAAGTVVGVFNEEDGKARGRTIVLRHTPEDTGLPFWIYTEYGHLNEMPRQVVGQRVRMGEVLGPTGNSGNGVGKAGNPGSRNRRRPAIHFAVYYAQGPRYAVTQSYVIPESGNWMDPVALYRKGPAYDTQTMKELPASEKFIPIPVMLADGKLLPGASKLIWPYACRERK